jgi:hypothetical protein
MSANTFRKDEPPEHMRFAAYLQALEQVADPEELDLVAMVLTDPDQAMAQSVIARHLDRRAANLCPGPAYEQWARSMTEATARHPFLAQRLREWSLFRVISLGQPWGVDALIASSDWLQRKITVSLEAADALAVLAGHGRTKRIRNAAEANLRSRG